jgi:hypothetical protein
MCEQTKGHKMLKARTGERDPGAAVPLRCSVAR